MENTRTENKEIARTAGRIALRVVIYLILICGATLLVFPYLWMLLTSFKKDLDALSLQLTLFPKEWVFHNYRDIWTFIPLLKGLGNTLLVEVSVIAVGTFVSAMAAFSFAKLKLQHKTFWLLFLMSGMMVPYAALMMPQFRVFMAIGMFDTLWPLILPGFFGNVSMLFFLVQYMRGIPNAYFEAARIDGAGHFKCFIAVMLPLVKTAIAAQIIFWFIGIWNDYFAPSIYLHTHSRMTLQPMLAIINSAASNGVRLPLIMTGAVLSSIPMLVIYITCQKFFIESLSISGVKG
ncbi:MAG: carbohydrate ABC transporter permease [Clostridia bacterium]|jgi:multiple sugar transport system permease protein|nr:carbohydrate ABC transporter permease [Clostridia bacterium]